jgi:hypothetical protein
MLSVPSLQKLLPPSLMTSPIPPANPTRRHRGPRHDRRELIAQGKWKYGLPWEEKVLAGNPLAGVHT